MPRSETDSIGTRALPDTALYGVNTLRATENFDISPLSIASEPAFIRALAAIKKAAAQANGEIGVLQPDQSQAISAACTEILAGQRHEHFVVNMLEGSGGTSINMNTNEVIANRALQILGYAPGEYQHLSRHCQVICGGLE